MYKKGTMAPCNCLSALFFALIKPTSSLALFSSLLFSQTALTISWVGAYTAHKDSEYSWTIPHVRTWALLASLDGLTDACEFLFNSCIFEWYDIMILPLFAVLPILFVNLIGEWSMFWFTVLLLMRTIAAQSSSLSVVCIAGQCVQGISNTTRTSLNPLTQISHNWC